MKLTFSDHKEINAIIAAFTEQDHEQIYKEVEHAVNRHKSSPVAPVLRQLCHDMQAFDLAADSIDFQDRMNNVLWDSLTDYHRFQYALDIFRSKHKTREAA